MSSATVVRHDFVLTVSNGYAEIGFPFNKQELANKCDYFANMFRWGGKEVYLKQATLYQCDPNQFERHLLPYLNGSCVHVTHENVDFLLQWADYMRIQDILNRCDEFLEEEFRKSHNIDISYRRRVEIGCYSLKFEGLTETRKAAFRFFRLKLEHGDQHTLISLLPKDFICRIGSTGIRSNDELTVTEVLVNFLMDIGRLDCLLEYMQVAVCYSEKLSMGSKVTEFIINWLNHALSHEDKITSANDVRITTDEFRSLLESRVTMLDSRKRKRRKCRMEYN